MRKYCRAGGATGHYVATPLWVSSTFTWTSYTSGIWFLNLPSQSFNGGKQTCVLLVSELTSTMWATWKKFRKFLHVWLTSLEVIWPTTASKNITHFSCDNFTKHGQLHVPTPVTKSLPFLRRSTESHYGGFGGLEVACWPLVPKFAGSHPAEAVGLLGRKKSSARLPSEGK
jgi:hypothetical protein